MSSSKSSLDDLLGGKLRCLHSIWECHPVISTKTLSVISNWRRKLVKRNSTDSSIISIWRYVSDYFCLINKQFLTESWVDVSAGSTCSQGGGTPGSISHQLNFEDYLRLLREAQRESNQSSARVSLAGSRRDSPRSSPKSPPNSPVQGTPLNLEWQSYYMNSEAKDVNIAGRSRRTRYLGFNVSGWRLL